MQKYTAIAPAKVNLNLFIAEKCENGLHELSSLFLPVSLTDKLSFHLANDHGTSEINFKCSRPELQNKNNLVYRAAKKWLELSKAPFSCEIFLEKSIPYGAGLGGGSSDAATTLLSLQKMAGKFALLHKDLMNLAFSLGSDVPYFLTKGLALVEGQGDKVTPLPWPGKVYFLLIKPDIEVSTALAFSRLDEQRAKQRRNKAIAKDKSSKLKNLLLQNDFTEIIAAAHPQVCEILSYAKLMDAEHFNLSGSGPTVYAMFKSKEERNSALLQASKDMPQNQLFACESLSNAEIHAKEINLNALS